MRYADTDAGVAIDMMQMDTVDASTTGTTARSQLYVQGAG